MAAFDHDGSEVTIVLGNTRPISFNARNDIPETTRRSSVFRSIPIVALVSLTAWACGGTSPTAPTPAPAPPPPPPAAIAGNWTGNLESSNWAASAINVNITQSGSSVTGTWAAAGRDWNGTITGTTDTSSFTGTFSLSAPSNGTGPRCTANASVSGPATTAGQALRWTSPGFTGSCTGLPISLTWNMQRR